MSPQIWPDFHILIHPLQIQLLSDNFGLQFAPALASDTTEYICLVNDRHIPEAIVDLLVQGELYLRSLSLSLSD